MENNPKCKLICEGIVDEMEGQEFYDRLIRKSPLDSDERKYLVMSRADEIVHETRLRNMDKMNKCSCNIPLKK